MEGKEIILMGIKVMVIRIVVKENRKIMEDKKI